MSWRHLVVAPMGSHAPRRRQGPEAGSGGGRTPASRHLWGHMGPEFARTARLAFARHGRVTRRQLIAEGIDAERIKRWLGDGRLRPVYRGVYAVGHVAPSMRGDYIAAVLAGGTGARLSHAPAAHLFKLTCATQPPRRRRRARSRDGRRAASAALPHAAATARVQRVDDAPQRHPDHEAQPRVGRECDGEVLQPRIARTGTTGTSGAWSSGAHGPPPRRCDRPSSRPYFSR